MGDSVVVVLFISFSSSVAATGTRKTSCWPGPGRRYDVTTPFYVHLSHLEPSLGLGCEQSTVRVTRPNVTVHQRRQPPDKPPDRRRGSGPSRVGVGARLHRVSEPCVPGCEFV